MRTEKYNGHVLQIEDNIEELTADRYNDFTRFVAMNSAIGSDLPAFDLHCIKIMRLCKANPEAAITEISNLQQSVHFILGGIHPEQKSFVALLHSIDGRILTEGDRTNEGMDKIIKELALKGLTIRKLRAIMDRVKKNFAQQFETLLGTKESFETQMVYEGIQQKYILILQKIQKKIKDIAPQLKKIEDDIDSFLTPVVFTGRRGQEVRMIKDFDNACALLSNFGVSKHPEKMKTFSFFNRLQWVKDQISLRNKPKK